MAASSQPTFRIYGRANGTTYFGNVPQEKLVYLEKLEALYFEAEESGDFSEFCRTFIESHETSIATDDQGIPLFQGRYRRRMRFLFDLIVYLIKESKLCPARKILENDIIASDIALAIKYVCPEGFSGYFSYPEGIQFRYGDHIMWALYRTLDVPPEQVPCYSVNQKLLYMEVLNLRREAPSTIYNGFCDLILRHNLLGSITTFAPVPPELVETFDMESNSSTLSIKDIFIIKDILIIGAVAYLLYQHWRSKSD